MHIEFTEKQQQKVWLKQAIASPAVTRCFKNDRNFHLRQTIYSRIRYHIIHRSGRQFSRILNKNHKNHNLASHKN